jgi:hypothetical protein
MEGMVRREYFAQLIQARPMQTALQVTAIEIGIRPLWPDKSNVAGLKKKASTNRATVWVYWVPVLLPDWDSNMATSSVVNIA